MAVETFLLGRNAKAYFNQEGKLIGDIDPGGSNPTLSQYIEAWLNDSNTIEADNLTDVSLNMASEFADATTRGTAKSGFSSQVPVLKNGEVTFEARWLPEDPDNASGPLFSFTRLLTDAWQDDGRIGIAFLDQTHKDTDIDVGVKVRTQGLVANWSVSLDKSEALTDIQRISVSLTIADSALWYQKTITGT